MYIYMHAYFHMFLGSKHAGRHPEDGYARKFEWNWSTIKFDQEESFFLVMNWTKWWKWRFLTPNIMFWFVIEGIKCKLCGTEYILAYGAIATYKSRYPWSYYVHNTPLWRLKRGMQRKMHRMKTMRSHYPQFQNWLWFSDSKQSRNNQRYHFQFI